MTKREEPPSYRSFKLVDLATQHQETPNLAGRSPEIHLRIILFCKELRERHARAFKDVGALVLVQMNA